MNVPTERRHRETATKDVTVPKPDLSRLITRNQTQEFSRRRLAVREHVKKPRSRWCSHQETEPRSRQADKLLTGPNQSQKNSGT